MKNVSNENLNGLNVKMFTQNEPKKAEKSTCATQYTAVTCTCIVDCLYCTPCTFRFNGAG